MDIAMFTESYQPSMGNKRRQTLVVPFEGEIKIYSRVTDGTKGPHNKWELTDLAQLSDEIYSDEVTTRKPVGVYVTSADQRAIESKGYSPVLTTKATGAHAKSPLDAQSNVIELISTFHEQIEQGDDNLEAYVIDNRAASTTTPVVVPVPTQTMEDAAPKQMESKPFAVSLATVPPIHLAKRYVHRKVYGVEDFKTIRQSSC